MRRIPSIDRIEKFTGVGRETAIKVRRILDGRDDVEQYGSVQRRIAECYSRPDDVDLILTAVDELLDTCGVEAIRADIWDRHYGNVVAMYCNSCDAYSGTILYDVERDVFYATTWGDWVETAERTRRYTFA